MYSALIQIRASDAILGRLTVGDRKFRCVLGRGGVRTDKQEGDGATPAGDWPLRRILYRPDRGAAPASGLPIEALSPDQGWCDDPASPDYNQLVTLPFGASHEALWREDALYDIIAVIGYNDDPVQAGQGSAIFLHIARDDFSPTEGCVALARKDALAVLEACGPDTWIRIEP